MFWAGNQSSVLCNLSCLELKIPLYFCPFSHEVPQVFTLHVLAFTKPSCFQVYSYIICLLKLVYLTLIYLFPISSHLFCPCPSIHLSIIGTGTIKKKIIKVAQWKRQKLGNIRRWVVWLHFGPLAHTFHDSLKLCSLVLFCSGLAPFCKALPLFRIDSFLGCARFMQITMLGLFTVEQHRKPWGNGCYSCLCSRQDACAASFVHEFMGVS